MVLAVLFLILLPMMVVMCINCGTEILPWVVIVMLATIAKVDLGLLSLMIMILYKLPLEVYA